MWCPQCESEVATEIAADGQSLLCVKCGGEVRRLTASSLHPDVQRARDILSRLSAASSAPIIGPDEPVELDQVIEAAAEMPPQPPVAPAPKRQFRIDRAHPTSEIAHTHIGEPAESEPEEPPESLTPLHSRSDEAHAEIPAPHFHVQPARPQPTRGTAESTWGQLMAYAGAGVLTIGTALVVWGYLGGPVTYAPTGWLVATAGQMLLVLGIVTLIAGGMQQTTHEVSSRVSHLNGRIIRIEQTANELLRGPHFGEAAQRKSIRSD
ncbi:MAG: hypothetical protein U0992_24260, partial [Planctomycetaceae bacterium]